MKEITFKQLLVVFVIMGLSVQNIYQQQLQQKLLSGYDFGSLPIEVHTQSVKIKVQLSLYGIKQLFQKKNSVMVKVLLRQKWNDYRLTWNPADYDGLETVYMSTLSTKKIWTPDISVTQTNGKMLFPNLDSTQAVVSYTGDIYWCRPGYINLVHKFDLSNYPFDTQTIKLTLLSWMYPNSRVEYIEWDDTQKNSFRIEPRFTNSNKWGIVSLDYRLEKEVWFQDSFSQFICEFKLKRKALGIVKTIFIPGLLISSLSVSSYLLPIEGPVRVKFIGQILLNMVVLTILLTTHLPISRARILLVDIFQSLIILIYTILVYILLVEKFRQYQKVVAQDFQNIIQNSQLVILQERIVKARKNLQDLLDNNAIKAKVKADLEESQKENIIKNVYQIDANKYKLYNQQLIIKKFQNLFKFFVRLKPDKLDFIIFLIVCFGNVMYHLMRIIFYIKDINK